MSSDRSPVLAFAVLLAVALVFVVPPADAQSDAPVQSVLEGRITVHPEIDSIPSYGGFELLVAHQQGDTVDTLGVATTDRDGHFRMTVEAPDRGIYPLVIRRRGTVVASDDFVVAPGETATLQAQLPVGNRPLAIRSPENSAWLAYRNTVALHRQRLIERVQQESAPTDSIGYNVEQTASILWNMPNAYPNTLGAAYARAEAVTLLAGWNDSLAVARARTIAPTNPQFLDAARTARRAEARLRGQASALDLMRTFQSKAIRGAQQAALQAEIVRAHIDSLEQDQALDAARRLQQAFPNTEWANWAERTAYEVQNLMPGMPAPEFTVTTWTGAELDLTELRGRPVILEFYRPSTQLYEKQIAARNAVYEQTREDNLALVSISLQPDTLLNEAFFDGRELPGTHVVAPPAVAQGFVGTYNLGSLPTRFLINAEGQIVGKYVGSAFVALREELAALLDAAPPR